MDELYITHGEVFSFNSKMAGIKIMVRSQYIGKEVQALPLATHSQAV
jgi:hypothetical protein